MNLNELSLGQTAFIVGVIGDGLLQGIVKNSDEENKWGLKSYFNQHGSLESITIAGGMLYVFIQLYKYFDPKLNITGLAIYGGILDLIFRYFNIFPSLKDYYEKQPIPISMIWGAIPLVLVKELNNI